MLETFRLDLEIAAGGVTDAKLTSTRQADATRHLNGQPLEKALRALPLLFPMCARAQRIAALRALEGPEGAPAALQRARHVLLAAEILETHGRSLWVEATVLFGESPDIERYAAFRSANRRLAAAVHPDGEPAAGAGRLVIDRAQLNDAIATMRRLLDPERPPANVDAPRVLRAWARGSRGHAGRLIAHALDRGWATDGPSDGLAAAIDVATVERRLDDESFCARPDVEGVVVEVGPLARLRDDPRVAWVVEEYGAGHLGRHWARLVELSDTLDSLQASAEELEDAPDTGGTFADDGSSVAMAMTARGPLMHRIRWADGGVVDWRRVAPTEWTCHPDGVVTRGPVGWPAEHAVDRARHHLVALDPCVPFEVVVHAVENARDG